MSRLNEVLLATAGLAAIADPNHFSTGRHYDPNSDINVTAACAFNPKRKKPAKPKTFQKKKRVKNLRRWGL